MRFPFPLGIPFPCTSLVHGSAVKKLRRISSAAAAAVALSDCYRLGADDCPLHRHSTPAAAAAAADTALSSNVELVLRLTNC